MTPERDRRLRRLGDTSVMTEPSRLLPAALLGVTDGRKRTGAG